VTSSIAANAVVAAGVGISVPLVAAVARAVIAIAALMHLERAVLRRLDFSKWTCWRAAPA